MSRRKRSTDSELQDRIGQVMVLLRQGHPESRIQRMLIEQHGICAKTARRLIQKAWDTFQGLASQASAAQRGLLLARLNHLYSETTSGDYKNFDQAIKLLTLHAQIIPKTIGEIADAQPHDNDERDNVSPRLAEVFKEFSADGHAAEPTDGSENP